MFTGIVEEVGKVLEARPTGLTIGAAKVMQDMVLGSSIAINGTCLTVTSRGPAQFTVDVVPETLRRTNLGRLKPGSPVNLERPVQANGRFDGHIVEGHVDATGTVQSITREREALLVTIRAPQNVMKYVVEKGFIAVDGTSLTIVNCDKVSFVVTIIPYTRENTVFGTLRVGDPVNLEVDIVAKYVERLLGK